MSMIPLLGGFTDPWPGATTVLDFVNNQYKLPNGSYINQPSAVPGWSFSRTGTEYEATSFGLLVPFASGVPAVTDLGLQVWEARTNLITQSQTLDNASWAKTDTTATADATTAPDGTVTADLLTEGSAGTANTTSAAATITASATYTYSIFLKKGNTRWVRFVFFDPTGTDGYDLWVDLTNGVLGSSAVRGAGTKTGATITAVANGFYRVTLSGVASTRTSANLVLISASADASFTRVSGATYYAWGAQIEAAAFAGPYIPTTSASATRGAASAIVNASALTAAQGTVIVSVGIVPAGAAAAFGYALGSVSGTEDGLAWQGNSTTVGHFNGSVSLQLAGADATAQPTRLALAWDANGRSIAYTGAASVASDANTRGTNTGGYVLGYRSGSRAIDTQIQRVLAYPTRLSSAQLLAAVA